MLENLPEPNVPWRLAGQPRPPQWLIEQPLPWLQRVMAYLLRYGSRLPVQLSVALWRRRVRRLGRAVPLPRPTHTAVLPPSPPGRWP